MKRRNFKVEANGEAIGIKHTWNAARKLTDTAIRQYAEHFREAFTLHNSTTRKDENGRDHIGGVFVWRSPNRIIHFTIAEII